MQPTPIFYGLAKDGKFKLYKRESFDIFVSKLTGEIQLTICKKKKPRSHAENRYYWGVIIKILSDETGHFSEEVHDALRHKFLMDGIVARSTKTLSTVEMEEYMNKIRIWANTDMNIIIPEPNSVEY